MKLRRAPVLAAAGAMLAAALIVVIPNAFATPPTGFADTVVASATLPVGLDFTPDGRMLVTTKPGQLYAYSKTGRHLEGAGEAAQPTPEAQTA